MPAVNQSLFEEAYLAFQEGRLSNAREILTRLIKSEPGNAQYWLLMSAVVESEKEKFFCLQIIVGKFEIFRKFFGMKEEFLLKKIDNQTYNKRYGNNNKEYAVEV